MENNQNVDSFIGEALNSEKSSVKFAHEHGADKKNPMESLIDNEIQTSHFIFS